LKRALTGPAAEAVRSCSLPRFADVPYAPRERKVQGRSSPRGAAFGHAASSRTSAGFRAFLAGSPRAPESRFDVLTNHTAYDLRGGEILLRTQPLEDRLLARIDQSSQTSGALFEVHYGGGLHLHMNYIVR
jgi:hypothetical protein